MPGFQNKIWGFRYHDVIRGECCRRVLGRKVCAPCPVRRYNDLSFYIGFNYPHVTPSQQATIYACATPAIAAAYSIIVGACSSTGPACVAAIPAANNAARAAFRTCMSNTDVPASIYRRVNIGIYHRRTTL